MGATRLAIPDAGERDALATFVGRAVQLEPTGVARLRARSGAVDVFLPTGFDVLVTHTVTGTVEPADVTVVGSDLLAALAVAGGTSVDPGTAVDDRWRGPVPADTGWSAVGEVPAVEVDAAARRGIAAAQGAGYVSASVLDETALTVGAEPVRVPMRCLLALSGLGLADDAVRVSTGGGWLRLDAAGGAVVRRRRAQLPLA